jgi:hypothetical protein
VRSRSVALVTRDPALYADLASALRERRIPTVSLLPGQRIPPRVAVALTSPDEAKAIGFRRVLPVSPGTDRAALWAAIESAMGGAVPHEIVVGIDPGPRPGYAVLDHERLLVQGSLDSPESSAQLGRQLHRRFPKAHLVFRVGSGERISRARILNALWPLRRPVELVDESGTTARGQRRSRDPESAERIARGRGTRIRERSPLLITAGDVADVQRRSREESGGYFTIPRSLAIQVLEGRLTLGEAIRQGEALYPRSVRQRVPAERWAGE